MSNFIDFTNLDDIKLWNDMLQQHIETEKQYARHPNPLDPTVRLCFAIGDAISKYSPLKIEMKDIVAFADDGVETDTIRTYCPRCNRSIPIYLNPECFEYCPKCGQHLAVPDEALLLVFDPTGEGGVTMEDIEAAELIVEDESTRYDDEEENEK